MIADHRDGGSYSHNAKMPQLSQQGFNCHFDNLVVESPFVPAFVIAMDYIRLPYSLQKEYLNPDFYSLHHFYAELRGPPVV